MNRLIQWFVENPIAANLCMVMILLGGFSSLFKLNKEVFPDIALDIIQVGVVYPGAGPKEVETQIVVRIEEAIANLDGIDRITSEAREGYANVSVEAVKGQDIQALLNDVKTRVDAITTFPTDVERPQVQQLIANKEVMSLALYGDAGEIELKQVATQLRDELGLLNAVSLVSLRATRDDEISIEVSEHTLRQYQLTFDDISRAIAAQSLDVPAGVVKSQTGNIQVQTRGQNYTASDFASVVVRAAADGSQLYLGDIATIRDGLAEKDLIAHFNGKPAVFLDIFVSDNPDILAATSAVKDYMHTHANQIPATMHMAVARDWSLLFKGRMNLLITNAISGLLLVFLVLMLFLRTSLALWVSAGIGVAFMGAIWLLPFAGISINMVSMFAMILVLGILVDDAIIVGESVYSSHQRGLQGNACAAGGAKAVSKPVLFAVGSTIIFFAPMLTLPGMMGDMSKPIPVVVILCLIFSLFESLLILPAHLAHLRDKPPSRYKLVRALSAGKQFFADKLEHFAHHRFGRWVKSAVNNSPITLALFLSAFFLSVAVVTSGWVRGSFMPVVPSEFIGLTIELPEGSAFARTKGLLQRVESAAETLKHDAELLDDNQQKPFVESLQTWATDNSLRATLALKPAEERDISTQRVTQRWRELIGDVPEAEKFNLAFTINQVGEAIALRLSVASDNPAVVERALADVRRELARYPGVYDVKDTYQSARTELELDLKDGAATQGFSLQTIARQVRQAFYGDEVQRVPRNGEDVRVMVRYPRTEREAMDTLEDMYIRQTSSNGLIEAPITEVATLKYVPGYTTIMREDRKRTFTITAEVRKDSNVSATKIVSDLMAFSKPKWQAQYPGFSLSVGGSMESENEFVHDIIVNFILALVLIYGLFCVAFKSYTVPALVLTAVPFGFMGAVIGHVIMGFEISMMSILGFLACAGVVVNDNLVLLDHIQQLRHEGKTAWQAAVQGAQDRFRPIVLTSITTFAGLTPMLLEESTQARFLVPMAVSLAFGVLFATAVTLLLVPSLYYGGSRFKHYCKNAWQTL